MDIVTYALLSNSKNIKITDTNNYFTSDNVEGVLSEIIYNMSNTFITDFESSGLIPYHSTDSLSGGTITVPTPDATHFGLIRYNSTSAVNSGYYFTLNQAQYDSSIIGLKQDGIFRTRNSLSNIITRIGFSHAWAITGERQDAIYLLINQTGGLSGRHLNNNVATATATSVQLSTNTFYRYTIENISATQIRFTLYEDNSDNVIWSEILQVPSITKKATLDGNHSYALGTTITELIDFDYMRVYRPNQRKVW